jgi:hypothetical protein
MMSCEKVVKLHRPELVERSQTLRVTLRSLNDGASVPGTRRHGRQRWRCFKEQRCRTGGGVGGCVCRRGWTRCTRAQTFHGVHDACAVAPRTNAQPVCFEQAALTKPGEQVRAVGGWVGGWVGGRYAMHTCTDVSWCARRVCCSSQLGMRWTSGMRHVRGGLTGATSLPAFVFSVA